MSGRVDWRARVLETRTTLIKLVLPGRLEDGQLAMQIREAIEAFEKAAWTAGRRDVGLPDAEAPAPPVTPEELTAVRAAIVEHQAGHRDHDFALFDGVVACRACCVEHDETDPDERCPGPIELPDGKPL